MTSAKQQSFDYHNHSSGTSRRHLRTILNTPECWFTSKHHVGEHSRLSPTTRHTRVVRTQALCLTHEFYGLRPVIGFNRRMRLKTPLGVSSPIHPAESGSRARTSLCVSSNVRAELSYEQRDVWQTSPGAVHAPLERRWPPTRTRARLAPITPQAEGTSPRRVSAYRPAVQRIFRGGMRVPRDGPITSGDASWQAPPRSRELPASSIANRYALDWRRPTGTVATLGPGRAFDCARIAPTERTGVQNTSLNAAPGARTPSRLGCNTVRLLVVGHPGRLSGSVT